MAPTCRRDRPTFYTRRRQIDSIALLELLHASDRRAYSGYRPATCCLPATPLINSPRNRLVFSAELQPPNDAVSWPNSLAANLEALFARSGVFARPERSGG